MDRNDFERRMLVSLAHPDDESFGMAGTIAHYNEQGAQISLICATNGDVGTTDPEYLANYSSMTELRLAELECAADELGLQQVYTLGYRDSGMEGSPDNHHPDSLFEADLDDVVRRITNVIRKDRPHVVVTFDPYGGYGHPDHVKMHRATNQAFKLAGDTSAFPEQLENGLKPYSPQKLYYRTRPRGLSKILVRLMPLFGQDPTRMGKNEDIDLVEIVEHTYPIHARLDTGHVEERAERARQCHQSQLGGFVTPSLLQRLMRLLTNPNVESFMRAYPPVKGRQVREKDLFEGVKRD